MSKPIKIMQGQKHYGFLFPNKEKKYAYPRFVGSYHTTFCGILKQELENSYKNYLTSREVKEPQLDFIGPNEFLMKILKSDFDEVLPSLKEIIFEFSHWEDGYIRNTVELVEGAEYG